MSNSHHCDLYGVMCLTHIILHFVSAENKSVSRGFHLTISRIFRSSFRLHPWQQVRHTWLEEDDDGEEGVLHLVQLQKLTQVAAVLEVLAQLGEAWEVPENEVAFLGCVVEPVILPGLEVVVLGVEQQTEGVGCFLHQLDLIAHRKLAETWGQVTINFFIGDNVNVC